VLLEMAAKAKSIRVLDHHASAQRDLEGLDFCTFDMNESGATLAWMALRPNDPMPLICQYVRDRDLWRWELENSKAINAWLGIAKRDFGYWAETSKMLALRTEAVASLGVAVLAHIDAYVESTAKNARAVRFCGYDVPFVNAPGMMASELIGRLADAAAFAVGFFQRADGKWQYSLRSRGDFDVSTIAEQFGGGGHRQAAGFESAASPNELIANTCATEVPHGE